MSERFFAMECHTFPVTECQLLPGALFQALLFQAIDYAMIVLFFRSLAIEQSFYQTFVRYTPELIFD